MWTMDRGCEDDRDGGCFSLTVAPASFGVEVLPTDGLGRILFSSTDGVFRDVMERTSDSTWGYRKGKYANGFRIQKA